MNRIPLNRTGAVVCADLTFYRVPTLRKTKVTEAEASLLPLREGNNSAIRTDRDKEGKAGWLWLTSMTLATCVTWVDQTLSDHRAWWLHLCRAGCRPIQNQVSQLCISPAKFKCSAPWWLLSICQLGAVGRGRAEPEGKQGVRQRDAAVTLSGAPSVPPPLTEETGTCTDSSGFVPKRRNHCRSLISEWWERVRHGGR